MTRTEVRAEVTGKLWKLACAAGDRIDANEPLMIVESMKMEIPVCCEDDCVVLELLVAEGDAIEDGQVVAIVQT